MTIGHSHLREIEARLDGNVVLDPNRTKRPAPDLEGAMRTMLHWMREVEFHLEQQSAPPEERHKSLTLADTLADLFEVCEKLAEDVRLERGRGRQTMPHGSIEPETHLSEVATQYNRALQATRKALRALDRLGTALASEAAPSAVQGEERTACEHTWVVYERQLAAVRRGGVVYMHCKGCDALREAWPPPPSSSPTATAQRGELDAAFEALREITRIADIGPVSWRCDCGHANVTRTCMNCGMKPPPYDAALYAQPDPLPAQTEPGERCAWCRQSRDAHGEGNQWIGHVFQAPTPPSPAPECAHDYSVIRRVTWPTNALSVEIPESVVIGCSKCPKMVRFTLPTEGEG